MKLAFRALLALGVAFASCKGKPEVGFRITLPSDLVDSTVWFEVGAFRDASCAAVTPMLADGVPHGATTRVAFRRDDAQSPRFGDLPNAAYAFAAVARGEDCEVLATGCTEADVGDTDGVVVAMNAASTPTGACGVGSSCQAAKCVPANDNADPSVGANCSLELLGAGPLANPVGGGGTLLSAPAIAATPSGFLIAYREIDPNAAGARLTVLPVDPAGGTLPPERPALPGRCPESDETDGVGLAMNGGDGMIALARAPCGANPALELLDFSSKPEVSVGSFLVSTSQTPTRLTLSPARAAAALPSGGVVVFTEGDVARVATMDPKRGIVSPSGTFGATSGNTGAWVAATDKVLALVAAGTGGVAPPPPADAGAEGGAGGSADGGADEGDGPVLRLVVAPVSTPLDTFSAIDGAPRAPIAFPGEWASIAATGTRVIVLSDGSGPGRSATFRTFDLDRATPSGTGGFSVPGGKKVATGDVAIQGDRAYFAALAPGEVHLAVYANASTNPTPLHELTFSREPRIPAISTVRDGRVAIAATDSRVAVVWTTAKILTSNDISGGYAVFACTK